MGSEPALSLPAEVTDARMLRTRAALRAALLALIEREPFDRITVRDIVAEAGVGYATFFRHHPTKAALLDDIAAEQTRRLMALTLPVLDSADTRATSIALCTYVDEHRGLWSALLTGGAAGAMREEFARLSREAGTTQLPANSWLPTELGVVFGVSATVEILAWWLRQPDDFPLEKIAEILDRLVIAPTVGHLSG